jgi:hypothetical protein
MTKNVVAFWTSENIRWPKDKPAVSYVEITDPKLSYILLDTGYEIDDSAVELTLDEYNKFFA